MNWTRAISSEIVIVVGGRALHVTRRDSRPVAAGDVLIVGASEARQYREIKDLRLINILFRPDKLHMELLDLSGVPGYQALFSFESSGASATRRKGPSSFLRKS